MKGGISNVFYLAFRLAPFIIVSFFTLQSLLNWDLKGIIYLVGLIIACAITIALGNASNPLFKRDPLPQESEKPNPRCNVITLGENGAVVSTMPVSITVYSYTLFYLLIFMLNLANTSDSKGILGKKVMKQASINAVLVQNVPMLVLFPLLILLESAWIMYNNCIYNALPMMSIIASIVIGGGVGVAWAAIITYTNKPELQYISKAGVEVCNQPTKMVYRCRATNAKGVVA